jgi:hypothetical protein
MISGSAFSRFGIRLDELPFVPADAAGKLRWAGSGIPLQPWLLGAVFGSFLWPATLFLIDHLSSLDFCTYSRVIASYVPVINLCEHPWRSGAILGAIFGGLLSRWRLATTIRPDELVSLLEKMSAPAGGTLPDPAQRAMLVIAGESRNRPRPRTSPVSAQIDRIFQDAPDDEGGGVAVAVEKAVAQIAGHAEPQLEGLNLWFDHAMHRASQRFSLWFWFSPRIWTRFVCSRCFLPTHSSERNWAAAQMLCSNRRNSFRGPEKARDLPCLTFTAARWSLFWPPLPQLLIYQNQSRVIPRAAALRCPRAGLNLLPMLVQQRPTML